MDPGLISQNAVLKHYPQLSNPIPAGNHHYIYIITHIMTFYSKGSCSSQVSNIWEQKMSMK